MDSEALIKGPHNGWCGKRPGRSAIYRGPARAVLQVNRRTGETQLAATPKAIYSDFQGGLQQLTKQLSHQTMG